MFFSSEQRANTNVHVQTTTCPWFSRMFHNRNSPWLISDLIPKISQKSKISKNFCMSLFGMKNELENRFFILMLLGVSEKFSKQILIFILDFLPLKIEIFVKKSYWIRYKILSLDMQSFNILDISVKSYESCSIFRTLKISEN